MTKRKHAVVRGRHWLTWHVAAAVVGTLVLLAMVGGLLSIVVWPDGVPFWGHPENDRALTGTWEGSYSTGSVRLVVNADHTFTQFVYGFSDVEPAETVGRWEYSDGVLRVSPGLWYTHGYTKSPVVAELVLSPTVELQVRNTVWPWVHRIWNDDMSLGRR